MQKSTSRRRTIVVLHGWTINPAVMDKWQPFIALLKQAGFTIQFWRLPGLTAPSKQPMTLSDYVSWLAEKTQSLPPFILLGHSFGGQLAVRFARHHPERIDRLILIDSSGLIDQSLPKTAKRSVFKLLAKIGKLLMPSETLRRWLYRFARETDYYLADPVQRKTMANVLADEIREDLSRVAAPTLIIWGEHDMVTPRKFADIFAQHIPDNQLKIIQGARHSPMYTHAQSVLSIIKKFLKVS